MKILFIPSNALHVETFSIIINELNKNIKPEIMSISLDKYIPNRYSGKALEEKNIYHRTINSYKTKNIKEILKKEKPDIMVFGSDKNIIEKTFIRVGNQIGIPSLLIQDGVLGPKMKLGKKDVLIRLFYIINKQNILKIPFSIRTFGIIETLKSFRNIKNYIPHGLSGCTKIAVFGEYTKNILIDAGVNSNNIVITGNPKFDDIGRGKYKKETIYKKFGIEKNKGIIVLATSPLVHNFSWTKEQQKYYILSIIKAVENFPDKQLVIKLKYIEKFEEYEKMLGGLKNKIILCRDVDLHEMINACEIFMSIPQTTTNLEAMVLNKPVIILNFFNDIEPLPYISSGAAVGVYRPKEIIPAIKEVLYDKETRKKLEICRKRFVREHAYKIDGKASERIAKLIKEMVMK